MEVSWKSAQLEPTLFKADGRTDRHDEAKSHQNINRHTVSFIARPSTAKLAATLGNCTIRSTARGLTIKETPCITLKCVIHSARNTQTDEF